MHLLRPFFMISLILLFTESQAQDPGVVLNTEDAFDGYTLFAPSSANGSYLIDNCGHVVNKWESEFKPGLATYLDTKGNLVRSKRIFGNVFNAGGLGGGIEKFDWDGKLLWSVEIADETQHQHHDFEILPNGNILVLAWDRKSATEALEYGRISNLIPSNGLWPEKIVEIKPIGIDSSEVVWEWFLWDHLIQDIDSLTRNFGDVAANPGKLDINFFGGEDFPGSAQADWIHANSLDYNPQLDQILFSSRNLNEIFVIDHSTTTQQAATSQGGKYGKGGDFLYRFGNPQSYKMGNENDKLLYNQHDANWVEAGLPGEGNIMYFNNGIGRPVGNISTVDEIVPPIDADGNYILDGGVFGPKDIEWSYGLEENDLEFFSLRISGVQRQPNGNTLICVGNDGAFIEVGQDRAVDWYYINPLRSGLPVSKGQELTQNEVFRAYKYGPEFEGFNNRTLTPGDRLEESDNPVPCMTFSTTSVANEVEKYKVRLLISNPVEASIHILQPVTTKSSFSIFDLAGALKQKGTLQVGQSKIDASTLPKGLYIIHFQNQNVNQFSSEKFIKL